VALAHSGCTGPELMAVSGHAALAQVHIYIERRTNRAWLKSLSPSA